MIRIGYPCINKSLECKTGAKFKLASFSAKKIEETVNNNLQCLSKLIDYNYKNNIFFFRISSDTIPFASHPINKYDWEKKFKKELDFIGLKIKKYNMRVSMHPDQFVVLNSPNPSIVEKSILELIYHYKLLVALKTQKNAKIQIHIGGGYGNKKEAVKRFIKNYKKLPIEIKERLVIENDDRIFNLKDCLIINNETGIPIVADYFHHSINNCGEVFEDIFKKVADTWDKEDKPIMIDYSSQEKGGRKGTHSKSIDLSDFSKFMEQLKLPKTNMDIMLEIKDKEKSALKALDFLKKINFNKEN